MLPQSTVDWFRREREAGRMPKSLPEGGAYDAMPRRCLNLLARLSARFHGCSYWLA